MAGSVLNSTFSFQKKFIAKKKVSASKSATSPSCKTLSVILKRPFRHKRTDQAHPPPKILAKNSSTFKNIFYVCQIMSRQNYVKYIW